MKNIVNNKINTYNKYSYVSYIPYYTIITELNWQFLSSSVENPLAGNNIFNK